MGISEAEVGQEGKSQGSWIQTVDLSALNEEGPGEHGREIFQGRPLNASEHHDSGVLLQHRVVGIAVLQDMEDICNRTTEGGRDSSGGKSRSRREK